MVSFGRRNESRRRDLRFPVALPLQLQVEGQDRIFGETINISRRGMLCRIRNKDLNLFSKARIHLELPSQAKDPMSVECEGVVFRVDEDSGPDDRQRVALYFHRLDEGKARKIRDCMIRKASVPDAELVQFLQTCNFNSKDLFINPLATGNMAVNARPGFPQAGFIQYLEGLTLSLVEEIKNPIAGIASAFEAIASSAFHQNSPYQEIYQEIFQDLGRVDDAVNALLAYCAPTPPRMRLLNFSRLIEDSVEIASNGIMRIHSFHGSGQPMIWADDQYLQQALLIAIEQFSNLAHEGNHLHIYSFFQTPPESLCVEGLPQEWLHASSRLKCLIAEVESEKSEPFNPARCDTSFEEVGIEFPLILRNIEMHGGDVSWCACNNSHPGLMMSLPVAQSLVH